jgi:hypothetical protein
MVEILSLDDDGPWEIDEPEKYIFEELDIFQNLVLFFDSCSVEFFHGSEHCHSHL